MSQDPPDLIEIRLKVPARTMVAIMERWREERAADNEVHPSYDAWPGFQVWALRKLELYSLPLQRDRELAAKYLKRCMEDFFGEYYARLRECLKDQPVSVREGFKAPPWFALDAYLERVARGEHAADRER